jgi:hypothetical protein
MQPDLDFQSAIDAYIALRPEQNVESKKVFRASGLSGCVRQTVRRRLKLSPLSNESKRQMEVGNILHRYMQQEVSLKAINRKVEFEKEIELKIDDMKILGHIDAYDGAVVYDFKTVGDLFNTLCYPISKSYVYQLSVYAHAMKTERAVVVYIDKKNLAVAQKPVAPLPLSTIRLFCLAVDSAEEDYAQNKILPDKDECFFCRTEGKL